MKRRVSYSGRIHFPFGFHTGDGRRLGVADQPLFREPDGSVALAGSSLAGVLRADLHRLLATAGSEPRHRPAEPFCRCGVCGLLGPEARLERGRDEEEPALRASRVHVSGGPATALASARIRDHVGIDRRTRTAAEGRKYDVEVAEAGVEFPFSLRLDDPEEEELRLLETALQRLAGGWLFLGGKTGSGLGRAEVTSLERRELDLGDRNRLVEHLLGEDPAAGCRRTALVPEAASPGGGEADAGGWLAPWEPPAGNGGSGWAQVRLGLELEFPWGFLVNDPAEALMAGFDHAFTRLLVPGGSPFLPGSALRGVLRSRAEQILRTLGGDRAACDLNRRDHACHERIDRENQERAQAGRRPMSQAEELALHCLACRVFGGGRLASAVKFTDFHPIPGRPGQSLAQEFVAVDRFTGGAAHQAKFDARSSVGPTFAGEIHLEIGPDRLEDWGLGLVALVLRDLLLGDVPVGFGTAKGFNEVRARIVAVERYWLRPPPALAAGGLPEQGGARGWHPPREEQVTDPAGAAEAAGERLSALLAGWVEALHRRLAEPPPPAAQDVHDEATEAEHGEAR